MDLLAYFESVASNTLATFNHTRSELRSLLFRLALLDTTPSSKCVLWSILALSAAHQHRHQHQTSHLKLAAIQLLKSSSTNGIDSSEGVRHLAASMILSASEIHAGEDITSHWCWFLCGSGHLMRHILGDLEALGSDGYMLQDWVTYHGALLKFSLRHWHRMAKIGTTVDYNESRTKLVKPGPVCSPSSAVKLPETSHSFLKLLQDIFDGVLRPSDTGYHDAAYAESLQNLERRIQNISNRNVSRGFSSQSEKIALYAERAFAIFSQADCCGLPFPLFIIGCEAQTDEQPRCPKQRSMLYFDRNGGTWHKAL
ncbi:hypothetical protein GQ53DRAFT_852405 [Thozetella sp. PMI_491]|nr:hypothetical protein GQ53DRAFT_852405 [Thozetella sp. PMI_491]